MGTSSDQDEKNLPNDTPTEPRNKDLREILEQLKIQNALSEKLARIQTEASVRDFNSHALITGSNREAKKDAGFTANLAWAAVCISMATTAFISGDVLDPFEGDKIVPTNGVAISSKPPSESQVFEDNCEDKVGSSTGASLAISRPVEIATTPLRKGTTLFLYGMQIDGQNYEVTCIEEATSLGTVASIILSRPLD